jgi:hypothetical protein
MQDAQDSDIGLEGLTPEGTSADRECQRGPETIAHEAQDAGTPNSGGRIFPEPLCRRAQGLGWRLQGTWTEGQTDRQRDTVSCCAGVGWELVVPPLSREPGIPRGSL